MPRTPKPLRTFTVYRDAGGHWRWRCTAGNNRITATSGESFSSQRAARLAASREVAAMPSASIRVEQ